MFSVDNSSTLLVQTLHRKSFLTSHHIVLLTDMKPEQWWNLEKRQRGCLFHFQSQHVWNVYLNKCQQVLVRAASPAHLLVGGRLVHAVKYTNPEPPPPNNLLLPKCQKGLIVTLWTGAHRPFQVLFVSQLRFRWKKKRKTDSLFKGQEWKDLACVCVWQR